MEFIAALGLFLGLGSALPSIPEWLLEREVYQTWFRWLQRRLLCWSPVRAGEVL